MATRKSAPAQLPPTQPYLPMNPWATYTGWDLGRIRAARDSHMLGDMSDSADLVEAAKTEPTIFTALQNRIAPHRGLPRVVECGDEQIKLEATEQFGTSGPAISLGTVADEFERMVMLGEGVAQNVWKAREDGSRLDLVLTPWPARSLRLNPSTRKLEAWTTEGPVEVVHGDGRWVVCQQHDSEPWNWGAIKPVSTLWAQLAYGGSDWQQASEVAGHARLVGELPPGITPESAQGLEFAELVAKFATYARAAGIIPTGAKVSLVEAQTSVWQIWAELVKQRTSEVVRCLLGQDGTITNEGGNYIKAAMLSGVRDDLVEGDLGAVGRALTTGCLLPWAKANFGAGVAQDLSTRWLFPDRDEDMRRESLAQREERYCAIIQQRRAAGFVVSQEWADKLADDLGVARAELLGMQQTAAPTAPATMVQPA